MSSKLLNVSRHGSIHLHSRNNQDTRGYTSNVQEDVSLFDSMELLSHLQATLDDFTPVAEGRNDMGAGVVNSIESGPKDMYEHSNPIVHTVGQVTPGLRVIADDGPDTARLRAVFDRIQREKDSSIAIRDGSVAGKVDSRPNEKSSADKRFFKTQNLQEDDSNKIVSTQKQTHHNVEEHVTSIPNDSKPEPTAELIEPVPAAPSNRHAQRELDFPEIQKQVEPGIQEGDESRKTSQRRGTWFGMYSPAKAVQIDKSWQEFRSNALTSRQHIHKMNERYHKRQQICHALRLKRIALREKYIELRPSHHKLARPQWNFNTTLAKDRTKPLLSHQVEAKTGQYSFHPKIPESSISLARKSQSRHQRQQNISTSRTPRYASHTHSTARNARRSIRKIYKSPFNKPAVLDAQFSEPMQMRRREHALQNQERTQSYAKPSSVRTPTVQSPYTRHPSSAKHTQQPTQVTQIVENTDHNGNGDGDDHTISESKSADRRDSVSAFKQQLEKSGQEVDRILEDFSNALYLPLKAEVLTQASTHASIDYEHHENKQKVDGDVGEISSEPQKSSAVVIEELSASDWSGAEMDQILDQWYEKLQKDIDTDIFSRKSEGMQ